MPNMQAYDGLGIGPYANLAFAIVVCIEPDIHTKDILNLVSFTIAKAFVNRTYQAVKMMDGFDFDIIATSLGV